MMKEWETAKRFRINFRLAMCQVIGAKVKTMGIILLSQQNG